MCLKLQRCEATGLSCDECAFERMRDAYQRTGGLASGDSLAFRLRGRCDQPISMLAHWVVERSLVSFEWRAALRIPLFQFSDDITVLRPAVGAVMKELSDILSDWEIAAWFAAPNAWLLDQAPCDVIRSEPGDVIGAARAARFVALG